MARLTLHTLETAPADSRPFVERAIANNGFLPNLIGVLANAPVALETYLTVSGINARSSLTLAEREVVQITAARIHHCDFCVAGHTAVALKKAQLPVETVRALQQATLALVLHLANGHMLHQDNVRVVLRVARHVLDLTHWNP